MSHGASVLTWLIMRSTHLLTGKVLTIIYSTFTRFERSKLHGRWWSCLHHKLEDTAEIPQQMEPWTAISTSSSAPQPTPTRMVLGTTYPQSGQCCCWIHTRHPPQDMSDCAPSNTAAECLGLLCLTPSWVGSLWTTDPYISPLRFTRIKVSKCDQWR